MEPDGRRSSAVSLQKTFSVSGQELVGELQGAKAMTAGLGGERGWNQPSPAHYTVLLLRANQPGDKGVGDTSCTSNTLSPSSQARMAPQI